MEGQLTAQAAGRLHTYTRQPCSSITLLRQLSVLCVGARPRSAQQAAVTMALVAGRACRQSPVEVCRSWRYSAASILCTVRCYLPCVICVQPVLASHGGGVCVCIYQCSVPVHRVGKGCMFVPHGRLHQLGDTSRNVSCCCQQLNQQVVGMATRKHNPIDGDVYVSASLGHCSV